MQSVGYIYRLPLIFCCLLLFSDSYCQNIRKLKPTKKLEDMLNPSGELNLYRCQYQGSTIRTIEPKTVACGTKSSVRLIQDTVYVAEFGTQTPCDTPPYLRNDKSILQGLIRYPAKEKEAMVMGSCVAFIRINTKGLIDSVWVVKAPTKNFEREVLAAVKVLPPFIPAKYKGKSVEAVCFYKVIFSLF